MRLLELLDNLKLFQGPYSETVLNLHQYLEISRLTTVSEQLTLESYKWCCISCLAAMQFHLTLLWKSYQSKLYILIGLFIINILSYHNHTVSHHSTTITSNFRLCLVHRMLFTTPHASTVYFALFLFFILRSFLGREPDEWTAPESKVKAVQCPRNQHCERAAPVVSLALDSLRLFLSISLALVRMCSWYMTWSWSFCEKDLFGGFILIEGKGTG